MKTIKTLLVSPTSIVFQLFYGGILSFIFLILFETENHYVKGEITILLSMALVYYLMNLISAIPSSLDLSLTGNIATIVLPTAFFLAGLVAITITVSGVWILPFFLPKGLKTDMSELLAQVPRYLLNAEGEGIVLGIAFQLLILILKILKNSKIRFQR